MGHRKRDEQFRYDEVCIVHTTQRCVRRARLVGRDKVTHKNFSHRRGWVRDRLRALASTLAVDVLAYAVMENHVHTLLRNRPDIVAKWTDREVALRWLRVFPGRQIDEELGVPTEEDVQKLLNQPQRVLELRKRLSDISWFMRALAEPIARRANREDDCTGRFWQGRFKAQRIIDDAGLLACAAYIESNPIRAGISQSIEDSGFTSALDRLLAAAGEMVESVSLEDSPIGSEEAGERIRKKLPAGRPSINHEAKAIRGPQLVPRDSFLAPLTLAENILSSDPELHTEGQRASDKGFLTISWAEYESLLRWTASKRSTKEGTQITETMASVFRTLGIQPAAWNDLVWNFKRYFGRSSRAGSTRSMVNAAKKDGKHWYRGVRSTEHCFVT